MSSQQQFFLLSELKDREIEQLIEHIRSLKQDNAPFSVFIRTVSPRTEEDVPEEEQGRGSLPALPSSSSFLRKSKGSFKTIKKTVMVQKRSLLRAENLVIIRRFVKEIKELHASHESETLLDRCSPFYYKFESVLNDEEKATLLFLLGGAQYRLRYLNEARHSYELSFELASPPSEIMALIHNNYAVLMANLRMNQLAILHFRKAINYHSEKGGDSEFRLLIGNTYHSIATVYLASLMYESAVEFFELAIEHKLLESQERKSVVNSKLLKVKSLLKCSRDDEAAADLIELKKEALEVEQQRLVSRELAQCYYRQRRYNKAIWEYYHLIEISEKEERREFLEEIRTIEDESNELKESKFPIVAKMHVLEDE